MNSFLSRTVQENFALKELLDFETRVYDKQLDLLMKVENLMHTPMRAMYPTLTLVETLSSLVTNPRA